MNGKMAVRDEGFVVGKLAPLAEIEAQEVAWLWPERIAADGLTLLAGDPDVGKSMVALDLAARISRGGDWPDGQPNCFAGGVLLLTAEDHAECSLRPKLEAAEADLAQICLASHVQIEPWDEPFEPHETSSRPINLARDLDVLGRMVEETPNCRMVVIDPITSFLGTGTNPRSLLISLMELAARIRISVLGVTHLKGGGQHALHRAGGGMALTTAARAVWMITRDPKNPDRRLFLPVKNNLTHERTGLAFEMIRREGERAPRVEWSRLDVETTADGALEQLRRRPGPDPLECELAEKFLRETLAGGGRPVKEVEAEAVQMHGIQLRTLREARKNLKVKAYREKVPGSWWVRLRNEEDDRAKSSSEKPNSADLRHLRRLGEITEDLQDFSENGNGEIFDALEGSRKVALRRAQARERGSRSEELRVLRLVTEEIEK